MKSIEEASNTKTMNAKKGKALFANIIAPGVGHFALKKWARGVIYIVLTCFGLIWLVWAFAACIIGAYIRTAEGGDPGFNLWQLIAPFIGVAGLWIISYFDLIFFCKVKVEEKK